MSNEPGIVSPARGIAAILGLAAFAVAVLSGLLVGNPGIVVLWNALVAMLVCQLAGMAIGAMAAKTIDDHMAEYKAKAESASQTPDHRVENV